MFPLTRFGRCPIFVALAVSCSVLAVGAAAPVAHAADAVTLTSVANLPNAVVMATRPSNGALYVGTQEGRVYLLRPGARPKLALDMRAYTRASDERGLLGLAFHPTLGYVYVSHTSVAGNSRLAEYVIRADGTFRASSRRLVLSLVQPYSNHNGGNVVFGPDGFLYLGFGDGGGTGDPQRHALNLNTWLGKIIRINPRPTRTRSYQVPSSNPFVGVTGAKPEIWSIGLRNPWRFSFDSATGDLWLGDVGQHSKEEVDLARSADGRGKGANFGWSAWEGNNRYNADQPAAGSQPPLYEYGHNPGCSITDGVVYHGSDLPGLDGDYLFADFCGEKVTALHLGPSDAVTVTEIASVSSPVSFGVDAAGQVYVVSLGGGVYRLGSTS